LDKESLLTTSDSIGNNKWEQENSYKNALFNIDILYSFMPALRNGLFG
jgi:hypothetical protein